MEKVQILMSTYNGEKYLKEQIQSILNQEQVEIELLVRDDGSNDDTIKILKQYSQNSKLKYYQGENIGPAKSFMDLINKSEKNFDYYAFADQDDIWLPNKIINAIKVLKNKENEPSLYISAQEIVDENLNTIGTKKVTGIHTLEGEIIRNFATGCTMVLNNMLCNIIKSYTPNYIIMHDSWITRVCYAIGGNVLIDDNSYIKYRQHMNNALGYKDDGLKKLKKQFKIAFIDKISMRENIAKELKNGYEAMLTPHAKELIDNLSTYRTNKKAKKWLLENQNFKTENFLFNLKLKTSIFLGKF